MAWKQVVERSAWWSMIHACYNKENPRYQAFGAKGTKVADAWRYSETGYRNFINDVGMKPSADLTLRLIDESKDYEPGNVHWVARPGGIAQRHSRMKGRSRDVRVEHDGEMMNLSELARRTGVRYGLIQRRHDKGIRGPELLRAGHDREGIKVIRHKPRNHYLIAEPRPQ